MVLFYLRPAPAATLWLLLLLQLLFQRCLQGQHDRVLRRPLAPEEGVHRIPPPLEAQLHERSLLALHLVAHQHALDVEGAQGEDRSPQLLQPCKNPCCIRAVT